MMNGHSFIHSHNQMNERTEMSDYYKSRYDYRKPHCTKVSCADTQSTTTTAKL